MRETTFHVENKKNVLMNRLILKGLCLSYKQNALTYQSGDIKVVKCKSLEQKFGDPIYLGLCEPVPRENTDIIKSSRRYNFQDNRYHINDINYPVDRH